MAYISRIVHALDASGAHIGTAVHEAQEVGGRVYDLDPRPIAAGDAAALTAVMSQAQAAAAVTIAAHETTIATLTADKQAAESARDAALARVADLEEQLATLTGGNDADGVPLSVSMAQGRIALIRAGKMGAVTAALSALPEPQKAEAMAWWEYSGRIERASTYVAALTPVIGTSADVDALFVAAAAIHA